MTTRAQYPEQLVIRVPRGWASRLRAIAAASDCSLNDVVRLALSERLGLEMPEGPKLVEVDK